MKNKDFSKFIIAFQDRTLPEKGYLVGYGAILKLYDLQIPLPDILALISQKHKQYHSQAIRAINTILAQTYGHSGQHIVEFEQGGEEKSASGSELLNRPSKDLTLEGGKGFIRSNLIQMRQLYIKFVSSTKVVERIKKGIR